MKLSWPKLIILAYSTFIGGMIFLVTQSFQQDIELEYDDYYQREVNYQDKIDAIQRVKKLKQQPEIDVVNDTLQISVPAHITGFDQGDTYFYHITEKSGDRKETLKSPKASFPVTDLKEGKYRIEIDWIGTKKRYFFDEELTIE